jgi:hypothetical protein
MAMTEEERKAKNRERMRIWRQENPEEAKRVSKKSYRKHRKKNAEAARARYHKKKDDEGFEERRREAARKRYYENREEILEKERKRYLEDPSKKNKSTRRWYEKNKPKKKAYDRKYCKENRQKKREQGRRWHEKNKDDPVYAAIRKVRVRLVQSKRRYLGKGKPFPKRTVELIGCTAEEYYSHLLSTVPEGVDPNDCHDDHIYPVSRLVKKFGVEFGFVLSEHWSNKRLIPAEDNAFKGDCEPDMSEIHPAWIEHLKKCVKERRQRNELHPNGIRLRPCVH